MKSFLRSKYRLRLASASLATKWEARPSDRWLRRSFFQVNSWRCMLRTFLTRECLTMGTSPRTMKKETSGMQSWKLLSSWTILSAIESWKSTLKPNTTNRTLLLWSLIKGDFSKYWWIYCRMLASFKRRARSTLKREYFLLNKKTLGLSFRLQLRIVGLESLRRTLKIFLSLLECRIREVSRVMGLVFRSQSRYASKCRVHSRSSLLLESAALSCLRWGCIFSTTSPSI